MIDKLKKFGSHSLIYGLGNVLGIAAGFLLIPLYTNVLSTTQYGILELLNRTADVLLLFMFMGIRQSYIRFYFDKKDESWKKIVTSTTIIFLFISSAVVFVVVALLRDVLSITLFGDRTLSYYFVLVLCWLPLELVYNIGLTHLQIELQSKKYVIMNGIRLVLMVVSNILLVYYFDQEIRGVLITNIWITLCFSLYFLTDFARWTHFKFSKELLMKMLKFGLPYIPSAFFVYIIANSDRFFLTKIVSLDAVGIYALAFKIGMLGGAILFEPFSKVWGPFLFDNYNKPGGVEIINKIVALFIAASAGISLAISVFSPVVLPIISGKNYHGAIFLIPMISIASTFYAMANIADAGILISKKTYYKPLIFGISSLITIIVNYIMISALGLLGACISLPINFSIMFMLTHKISSRYFALKIDIKNILVIFGTAVALYLVFYYAAQLTDSFILLTLGAIAVMFLYFIILWFSGFVSKTEKAYIKGLIDKLLAKEN